jgi:predicted oxidoreductase
MPEIHPTAERLIFGCHSIATLPSLGQARKLINQALELGIRDFDTAPLYSRGYSEMLLGQLLEPNTDARLTTKAGYYPRPSPKLIPRLALPAHWLKSRLTKRHHETSTDPISSLQAESRLSARFFGEHINGSLQRLKARTLDTVLLHEVMPFDLPKHLEHDLTQLIDSGVAKRLGYGGVVPIDWLHSPMPSWLSVLQLALPVNDPQYVGSLEEFIAHNPDIEVRVFGLFRISNGAALIARDWIHRYPNCRAVFSCRSIERLRANAQFLLN